MKVMNLCSLVLGAIIPLSNTQAQAHHSEKINLNNMNIKLSDLNGRVLYERIIGDDSNSYKNLAITENLSRIILELKINKLNNLERRILKKVLDMSENEIEKIQEFDMNYLENFIFMLPEEKEFNMQYWEKFILKVPRGQTNGLDFEVTGWTRP